MDNMENSSYHNDIIKGFDFNREDFKSPAKRNLMIGAEEADYVILADENVTSEEEIRQIITENDFLLDYGMAIFGENVQDGEIDFNNIIDYFKMNVYGVVIKKSILVYTGCYNEELTAGIDYELAVRVAYYAEKYNYNGIYGVLCSSEENLFSQEAGSSDIQEADNAAGSSDVQEADNAAGSSDVQEAYNVTGISDEQTAAQFLTYAYVLKLYMKELTHKGLLENAIYAMKAYADSKGCADLYNGQLLEILNNDELFAKIKINTAPFYVIMGDNTCHGVLRRFAGDITKSLIKKGQAVITSDGSYGMTVNLSDIEDNSLKGFIGFQSIVLFKDYFRKMKCPKYIFWFDNPMYFGNLFEGIDDKYYLLCQDRYYAEFIEKHFGAVNALQLPPAGEDAGWAANKDRPFDIVFIGACNYVDESVIKDEFQKEYYEYMKAHPNITFEQGLKELLVYKDFNIDEQKFLSLLDSLQDVCRNIVNYYRTKVLETLLAAGIKIDVFGDTWDRYSGLGKDNLIKHDAVNVDESLEIWGRSKIGLNVMTWHKAGMTERIANICLSGAVCLSERTEYLDREFNNYEDIVTFNLEHLEKLPDVVRELLANDSLRESIAQNAYIKASKEHIWDNRAESILRGL